MSHQLVACKKTLFARLFGDFLKGERDEESEKGEKEFKISSISDLMVFDRKKRNGMNIKQNDINNRQ